MKYCSTRGGVSGLSFVDSLLIGLAPDGGLLVPEQLPDVGADISRWRGLNFVQFAQEIIPLFATDIAPAILKELIVKSYENFEHEDVVGWQQLGDITVMELFHGPTLAFKDIALQFLGRLFEHVLALNNQHLNILGATSGDTGSAAIAGVCGQPNVDIFILYPDNRVSPLQELQMTTVPDENVHCLAIDGSFDDCQSLMKEVFADLDFKKELNLGAVNSVNWARILAQVVYYGYASLKYDETVSFCVPTGNFGNIFAAYLARQMNFPIDNLLVATNENDILARFIDTGEYSRGDVHQTLSPAMDIQVASNFERYLYYHFGKDTDKLCAFMEQFQTGGSARIPPPEGDFLATAVDTKQTLDAVRKAYCDYEYVLDPHTAVSYAACGFFRDVVAGPLICVATAHPAKFPDAVHSAVPQAPAQHPALDALIGLPQRKKVIEPTVEAIKDYLRTTSSRVRLT